MPAIALALVAIACVVLWSDFVPAERDAANDLLTSPRVGLLVFFAVALAGVLAFVTYRITAPMVRSARQVAEEVQLTAHGNPEHRLSLSCAPPLRGVVKAVNDLAGIRSQLMAEHAAAATEAKAQVDEERKRLAALVAELDQSVLVCNRDGRVLLYNAAAKALLGGAENGAASDLIGLGRSVFGIIDRAVIMHAVEAMEQQTARSTRESTHFVTTTRDGRLLRVHAAPVAGAADAAGGMPELSGYVLLLSDVTEDVDADAKRVALFQGLVETTRAALANIRAAIENLTEHPEMDAARRARFGTIIRDEAVGLSERLHRVTAEVTERLRARWPLEEMRGEDLLTLARRRIERRAGLPTKLEAVDSELWLRVDSFSLAQGLSYVARRLKDEFQVREVRFRLAASGGHAQLDIVWQGPPLSSETAFAWQSEPFTSAGEESALTLTEVIERHAGEMWYQRDVPAQVAYFRFLLPLAGEHAVLRSRSALPSRPEFYDFDLFRHLPATDALDHRLLTDLAFTVFDTETTGLRPSEGDEIIAIGAVRIVNERLLQGETFESLIDPGRGLPESAVAVHGITPEALRGAPTIDKVLPRFHRFAAESVLVGHNAAFDMRFLQFKEAQTGVRFEQPVLDTLLLSAVVHPEQDLHGLEDIAARLGVAVIGRHTALGDALLTAEAFLRMIPLLAEQGIRTLGEARVASKKTYYARLEY